MERVFGPIYSRLGISLILMAVPFSEGFGSAIISKFKSTPAAGVGLRTWTMKIPQQLPAIPGLREAVGDFLAQEAPPDTKAFALSLDRLLQGPGAPASAADIPPDTASFKKFLERAETSNPEEIASRLARLDVVLWQSPLGLHCEAVQKAFEFAHASIPKLRQGRVQKLIAATLRELNIPPPNASIATEPGSTRFLSRFLKRSQPKDQTPILYKPSPGFPETEILTPAEFETRFSVKFIPTLDIPFGSRSIAKGSKTYKKMPLVQRMIGDAYKADAIAGRQARTYIAPAGEKVGYGLFAVEEIGRGAFIGEYSGDLTYAGGVYAVGYLKDDPSYPLNLNPDRSGNQLRFMNHSDVEPNAKLLNVFYKGIWHVVFVAIKPIHPNEQLLWDYGPDYWKIMKLIGKSGPEPLNP